MPNRSSKQGPEDANETAFRIMKDVTGPEAKPKRVRRVRKKNPAAVELGRLGGLKGGKARAAKLSKRERSNIARKAAHARWSKEK